jgi:deferrochelatase/peroxidase EfeB
MDAELGQLDAGLFFISYQNDPASFVELQRRLAASDALNEYVKHRAARCSPALRERGRAATSARRSSGSSQARG